MTEPVSEREARARATTEVAAQDINVRIQRTEMDAQRVEASDRFAALQAEMSGGGQAAPTPVQVEPESGRQL